MTLKGILLYVLAYLLWLVNVVVCVVAVIEFRSTINVLWITAGHSRWILGLADQLSLLLGGLAVFVYVMFLESYDRQSVTQQDQKPRTGGDALTQAHTLPQGSLAQWLTRVGLAVLLRRFALTIMIPLGVYAASLVAFEAAWRVLR
jgi:hypothetical protein